MFNDRFLQLAERHGLGPRLLQEILGRLGIPIPYATAAGYFRKARPVVPTVPKAHLLVAALNYMAAMQESTLRYTIEDVYPAAAFFPVLGEASQENIPSNQALVKVMERTRRARRRRKEGSP